MKWTITKQGTNGDFCAPTIVDSKINADWVAIRRAKEVLYKSQPVIKVKPIYGSYDRGQVVKIGNYHYNIEEVGITELPFVELTLRRLDN